VIVPLLLAGIFVARHNPIHIRRSTKVYVTSVVYFLIAVLLPPPLAACVVALGLFAAAWASRKRTGNSLADITTQAARWLVIVLLGSHLAHLRTPDQLEALGLAAAFMFAADILTFPVLYTPLHGDAPIRVIRLVAREAGPVEGAQYLIGVMAALQIAPRPYALVLFVLPTFMVWWAFKQAKAVSDETHQMLLRLADTVDMRDPYTGGHSRRVAELTRATLATMNMHGPEAEIIVDAARVHDIGKIGIPDAILLKPSPLTPDEQAVMNTHPEQGAQLLERYADWSRGVAVIRHHHEAWDGSGYPHRLKGHEIEFGARVIAVIDAYDAMTTERPYRRAMSPDAAATVLRDGRGRQWDGEIVDAFLATIADRLERPASALLRVVPDYRDEPASTA
jgi:HD-GYP domain-containing protein (c-di-GMP phosphodiesterase class II)